MFVGLIPSLWATAPGRTCGSGSPCPMAGGIFTSFVLELVVYPAIYEIWKWHLEMQRRGAQPHPAHSPACPHPRAKAGVDMLTRCGALELGPSSIRVVGIAPGLVETPLTRNELENPEIRELFMAVIPMKRAVEVEEIAGRRRVFSHRNRGDPSTAKRLQLMAVC
ncbi:MAG TPA: SDR family oxidoreductase [Vicinamibacterales bacterium]|nr:SDR family oxidoreductase [Vicinamibacterales bacterium]